MTDSRRYQPGDFVMTHPDPIWRERGDFAISAYLGFEDSRHEWEQFCVAQTGQFRFKLCCIPFLAKDIALGDEVETDENYIVRKVVNPSGHWTFRVYFPEPIDEQLVLQVINKCKTLGLLHEDNPGVLLAISTPDGDLAQDIADYLWALENQGKIEYDTGKSSE